MRGAARRLRRLVGARTAARRGRAAAGDSRSTRRRSTRRRPPTCSSLNVVHELNAGLTRFSGRGVEPDLAESWEPSENGLVWTFHLRKGLRWSNDVPITAEDFRRSWLRALAPETRSAYARAEMQNIRGARRYRVTGSGEVGVEAVDDRTLRVTLQHPVPWLDEQVAWPVFFPVPRSGNATSGPFRLASRTQGPACAGAELQLLERRRGKAAAGRADDRRGAPTGSFLSGLIGPGFPWVQTTNAGAGGPPAADPLARAALARDRRERRSPIRVVAGAGYIAPLSIVPEGFASFVPPAMPGFSSIVPARNRLLLPVAPQPPADPRLHRRGMPARPSSPVELQDTLVPGRRRPSR